ncbi:MAG: 30S ribosomal protein S12 methylthiotransferase RimO [Candidatus Binatia bacterium]
MTSRKVHLSSLGCPKNQVDAEIMLGRLVAEGYEVTLDPAEADVLVVNTCSFIQPAKEESIDAILEMARLKAGPENKKLVVTGCLAERYGKELTAEMPEVDAFVGTGDFLRLGDVIEEIGRPRRMAPIAYVGAQHVLPDARAPRILAEASHSAYVKVSEGCNHRCAFCIIPKIRGRHESRPVDDIVAEVEGLVAQGVREVNLIAQDLTAYGRDLVERASLSGLLRRIARVDGIDWIRLLYCYPNFVNDELLETMATEPKVCPYIDMPLQHGSDRMLRAMRRERSALSLRRLVARVRARIPHVALRTSFIVGFPGETEEDFGELCAFVRDLEFDRVGVFRYSQEEDTEAGALAEQVEETVKQDRWDRLMRLQREISRRKNQRWVGRVAPLLGCGEDENGRPYGRTAAQAPEIDGVVYFHEAPLEPGELAPVRIVSAGDYDLVGRRVASAAHQVGVDSPAIRP